MLERVLEKLKGKQVIAMSDKDRIASLETEVENLKKIINELKSYTILNKRGIDFNMKMIAKTRDGIDKKILDADQKTRREVDEMFDRHWGSINVLQEAVRVIHKILLNQKSMIDNAV